MNDYAAEVLDYRRRKDAFFASGNSPLTPEARAAFTGLAYYPPDPAYRLTVPLERASGEETLLATSSGETRPYSLYATAQVTLPHGTATLQLYAEPGDDAPTQLFVPFRDATSGPVTYGAGRYLEAQVLGDVAVLDFNLAYHPYCAYAQGWSCPLPPAQNWLGFPVEAGERHSV